MHNFVLHSNESACRKSGRLGLEQVIKVGHTKPIKAQLLPYKKINIVYGDSKQLTADTDTNAPLDAKVILCV